MAEQLANSAATTLSAAITSAGATTATVTNGSLFPSSGNFRILIDTELILVGARSGNNLSSMTRGIEGTTAATHSNGATATHLLTKGGLDQYLAERSELAYTEFTATASPTATTEATANTVVTASAVTFDGATVALIEFFVAAARPDTGAAGRTLHVWLYQDGSSIGELAALTTPTTGSFLMPIRAVRRMTPASGSRTYSVRASVDAGTGAIFGGAGGTGADFPGFIRITRV